MPTEGYNGIRKTKQRRVTALTEIDAVDEYRRAFGVYQLCQCMMTKPEVGKSYHIITGGAVDLIAHVQWLNLHWKHFTRLFISAWAISGADILLLEKWHGMGMFDTVEILVGDIFPSKYKMEWAKLLELQEKGIVTNVYKSTIHSKLLLMEADDGTHLVIESSANCNMNPRVEQSCVTISDKLFDFYWVYLHEMFDEELARLSAKDALPDLMTDTEDYGNIDINEGPTLFGEDNMGEGLCAGEE